MKTLKQRLAELRPFATPAQAKLFYKYDYEDNLVRQMIVELEKRKAIVDKKMERVMVIAGKIQWR